MSNDDDECDSHVASQSDVTSFLQEQSAKNTGLTSNIDDDDIDTTSLSKTRNSYLSQSCFASISPKSTLSDDLTELKWLNTFKLKDYLSQNSWKEKLSTNDHDRVNELIQQLKTVQFDQSSEVTNDSLAICLFLAFHSKRDDPSETSWSMTMKQCYEYFQSNFKTIVDQRHWKYLLRQTLISFPCFIQKKDETNKTRLLWTIDSYYRPLLMRAYRSNVALTSKKTSTELSSSSGSNEERPTKSLSSSSQSIIDRYPPKATIKKAALPRLFERLCEESNLFSNEPQTERKRARSTSLLETQRPTDGNDQMRLCLSTSSTWRKKSKKETTSKVCLSDAVKHQETTSFSTKESTITTPYPSIDHSYTHRNHDIHQRNDSKIIDDERDSLSETKSKSNQRRKVSPGKKQLTNLVPSFPSHRARTRMSRRIIEHDLKLLRQAQHSTSKIDRPQPLDLSTTLLQ